MEKYLPLILLAISWPVQAIILDEEPPAAKPAKPKAPKKNAAELEVQRLKKELAAIKKQQTNRKEEQSAVELASSPPGIEMVALPSGILMGKYEVTQGQWQAVMGNNPSGYSSCGESCPVENVSWNEVQQFIERLNTLSGKVYRLPSESEWYAACGSASSANDYCGSKSVDTVAWHIEPGNHAVGQKQPNGAGLYDMYGNAYEWTSSCWKGDCSLRTTVGGVSYISPDFNSPEAPEGAAISYRYKTLGFRLAQDR